MHCASGCKREMCSEASPSDVSCGRAIYNDLSVSSGRSDIMISVKTVVYGPSCPVLWKKRRGTDYPFRLTDYRTPRSPT